MTTIPANTIVNIQPSALDAGGSALSVLGLFLTTNTRAPIGSVLSFPSGAAVADYFGASSAEAIVASGAAGMGSGYFEGFTDSRKKPAAILFAQYNEDAVAAYTRGGDISSLTLAELQALSGSLGVTFDGYSRTSSSISLSGATSFSSAASIIQAALNAAPPTIASLTGSISGTTLTVGALSSGTIGSGQTLSGTGVTAGTVILSQLSGSLGGTGTYLLNTSQTAISGAMTTTRTSIAVAYDSVSGAFVLTSGITGALSSSSYGSGTLAASIKLTALTGAVLSQGAAAASPAAFMNALIIVNRNWVTFTTMFDPDAEGESTVRQAFAAWKNAQNNRFAYVCADADPAPTLANPAPTSLGDILTADSDSGTALVYQATDLNIPAFVMGAAASIDFTERNGRISFAFKSQAGLVASVSDPTVAANLAGDPQTADSRGNGYNFYGAYGAATANFIWFQRGFVTGPFKWLDAYINQIWMNDLFQNALLVLLGSARSIPYTTVGRNMIESALADPIAQAKNFGAFGPGPLSASQKSAVNNAAGDQIADTIQTQGYYLQITPPTPAQRSARISMQMTFWYLDTGAVQALNLSSVALL